MKFKFIFSFVVFIILTINTFSQPSGPNGPIEPPLVPFDGGVSILLAAGALFGMKKLYDANKRKK